MKPQSELSVQEEQVLGIYCAALRGLYQALLSKVAVFLFGHGGATLVDLQQVETFLQTILNRGEPLEVFGDCRVRVISTWLSSFTKIKRTDKCPWCSRPW